MVSRVYSVASNIANHHVQNNLPICLIHLPHMKLLRRSDIISHLKLLVDQISTENQHPADSKEWNMLASSMIRAHTEYAILSHRWLNQGELSFLDLTKLGEISVAGFKEACTQLGQGPFDSAAILHLAKDLSARVVGDRPRNGAKLLNVLTAFCSRLSPEEKARCGGLVKLVQFCSIAARRKCNYVWMDTCCIDKSRSAELEESIRSMFRWYKGANICVVHLADTHTSRFYMRRDAWFTRGWTLQELLAPKTIKFFNRDWRPLTNNSNDRSADTDRISLWRTISEITGIDIAQLRNFTPGMHNVRQVMVWASKRQTTRIEDVAYSLIGILDVPLSIAYGEGPMAFYRLQREIVQYSRDKGIFVWQGEQSAYNSMFAAWPKCFSPAKFDPLGAANPGTDLPHTITNFGTRMSLSLYDTKILQGCEDAGSDNGGSDGEQRTIYILMVQELGTTSLVSGDVLSMYDRLEIALLGDGEAGKSLALLLGYRGGQYRRIATQELIWVERPPAWRPTKTIYIN